MIDKPGIYAGLSMGEYLADPAPSISLSSGIAHKIDTESPMHAWFCTKLNPKYIPDHSKEADIGSVAHDILLEGGTDRIVVIDPVDYPSKPQRKGEPGKIPDGWTNTAIRAARDEARSAGKYPILKRDAAAVQNMVDAAREFIERTEFRGVFQRAKAELTMLWQEGPIWLRARPDLLADDRSVCLHVKTTAGRAHPKAFERIVDSQGYDFSMMFYARGLAELEPTGARTAHVILAQEQDAPWSCALFDLDPPKASIASGRVDRAIATWAQCLKTGKWPAYSTRIHSIEAKPWHLAEEEERTYRGLGEIEPEQERYGVQA